MKDQNYKKVGNYMGLGNIDFKKSNEFLDFLAELTCGEDSAAAEQDAEWAENLRAWVLEGNKIEDFPG